MRIFGASPPPTQTSEDIVDSSLLNGWPYLLMVNALGEEKSLASFVHSEIRKKLPSLFQALCAMKNPAKEIISNACNELIDELQKKFDMGKNFEEVHSVTFTVVMMLPSTDGSRKVACFGLGNNMVVAERTGQFITLKPAILVDGHSRSVPCMMRSQREKLSELKREIEERVLITELQANDTVYLLSPECHQFLQRESICRENEESVSLLPEQEIPSFSKLKVWLLQQNEAKKQSAFKKKLSDNAVERELLNNKILALKEKLNKTMEQLSENLFYQKSNLLRTLAQFLHERRSVLDKSITGIIAEHNALKLPKEDQAKCIALLRREKKLRSELDNYQYRLSEMLSPDTYGNPDPDFTQASMWIPENDTFIFQLRMEACMLKVDKVFNNVIMQARSRIPDSSQFNSSFINTTLNHYCKLFKITFKHSMLGRFLVVLAICNSTLGDLLLGSEKPRIDDLVFDARKILMDAIDLLKAAWQKTTLDDTEIVEAVLKLDDLLSGKKERAIYQNSQ